MAERADLQTKLENILGSKNVYFQPPANLSMKYPAVMYHRLDIDNTHANNSVYKQNIAYKITVIYMDPDSDWPLIISKLPMCRFDRSYVSDNLYHDVFTLYF